MISNRHIKVIAIALTVLVTLGCLAAMFFSEPLIQRFGKSSYSMEYETALFDTNEVLDISIAMEEVDWQEMLNNATSEVYYQCDVTINGEKASELMINAMTAAYYKVPVLCVTGDKGLCDYMKKVNPNVETVPVNEGWGNGVISIHPDVAVRRIRELHGIDARNRDIAAAVRDICRNRRLEAAIGRQN